jgi:hypothetical protein
MSGFLNAVKSFFVQRPALDSIVRHFLTTFVAVFVVAEIGFLKTIDVAHFTPHTLVASEAAIVVAAVAAAVRAVVPLIISLVTRQAAS